MLIIRAGREPSVVSKGDFRLSERSEIVKPPIVGNLAAIGAVCQPQPNVVFTFGLFCGPSALIGSEKAS